MKSLKIFCTLLLLLASILQITCVIVTDKNSATFIINNKNTTLTFAEIVANAAGDILTMANANNEQYKIGPTWTFFNLPNSTRYRIKSYYIEGHCSCYKQECGVDCNGKRDSDCFEENPKISFWDKAWCSAGSATDTYGDNYCWSFFIKTNTEYVHRAIDESSTIVLTTWKGATNVTALPGYTLKDTYQGIDYSLTGVITDKIRKTNLLSNLRYAHSEERLVFLEDILYITDTPTLGMFNVKYITCPPNSGQTPMFHNVTFTGPTMTDAERAPFTLFTVLHNATSPQSKSTADLSKTATILGLNGGLTRWVASDPTFDIIDPCNRQFLTLQRDQKDNVFVITPPGQPLTYLDIICIAVKEDVAEQATKLVLYQIKNGTADWTPSSLFVGGLSNNYLNQIQVKITTKSDLPLSLKEGTAQLQLIDADPPIIKLITSIGLECQISLSKTCTFTLITTDETRTNQKPITDCGYWYPIVSYNCEGIFGSWVPPAKYTNVPIDEIFAPRNDTVETTNPNNPGSGSSSSGGIFSIFGKMFDFFRNLSLDKLVEWLMVGVETVAVIAVGVLILSLAVWTCKKYGISCLISIVKSIFTSKPKPPDVEMQKKVQIPEQQDDKVNLVPK